MENLACLRLGRNYVYIKWICYLVLHFCSTYTPDNVTLDILKLGYIFIYMCGPPYCLGILNSLSRFDQVIIKV
jgi:hypothetical protein